MPVSMPENPITTMSGRAKRVAYAKVASTPKTSACLACRRDQRVASSDSRTISAMARGHTRYAAAAARRVSWSSLDGDDALGSQIPRGPLAVVQARDAYTMARGAMDEAVVAQIDADVRHARGVRMEEH